MITVKNKVSGIEHDMSIGLFHEWVKYQQNAHNILMEFTNEIK